MSYGTVSIGLLGPLSARLNGKSIVASAPKQRQALALLSLNAGHVVTNSMLVEELWGDHPPRSYATTLQTYILQIRNAMAAASPGNPTVRQILATGHGGYLFEAQACRIDVEEMNRLARAGRLAAESGDYPTASAQLSAALACWRGPTMVDVRIGRILELEVASLEHARMGMFERRVEADLALGRHADLVGELSLAAARNPMNENLCMLLMITFYRVGYVGRSLETYNRLRRVLCDELGVEPCPRLQRLQQAILSGDPELETRNMVNAALAR
jgi:DNA-binding SARP family transcriptional activator